MPDDGRPLRVAVTGDWGDIDEAIRWMTPGGSGQWGATTFGPLATIGNSQVLVVLNRPPRRMSVVAAPERVWLAIGEPPTPDHGPLHVGQGEGTVVVTCDPAVAGDPVLAAARRYILEPPILRTWQIARPFERLRDPGPIEKSRDLSWITSALSWLPGHRRRLAFLAALQARVAFDLFGRDFRPIADKWDGLAPYRYSIAFENCIAPGYFSEKLMDCFLTLTMPIYVGAPDIERYFPADAMVRIDPDDPDVCERIVETVASDRWRRAQDALREARRRVMEERNMFARLDHLMRRDLGPPGPTRRVVLERTRLPRRPGN